MSDDGHRLAWRRTTIGLMLAAGVFVSAGCESSTSHPHYDDAQLDQAVSDARKAARDAEASARAAARSGGRRATAAPAGAGYRYEPDAGPGMGVAELAFPTGEAA